MKTILAAIYVAIAAVRSAFAIKKIVEEEGNVPAKIAAVSGELSKVAQKFQSLTKETAATWDDDFADAIKTILDAIAENLVEGLGL